MLKNLFKQKKPLTDYQVCLLAKRMGDRKVVFGKANFTH